MIKFKTKNLSSKLSDRELSNLIEDFLSDKYSLKEISVRYNLSYSKTSRMISKYYFGTIKKSKHKIEFNK